MRRPPDTPTAPTGPARAAASTRPAALGPATPRVTSKQLLGDRRELEILHAGACYRLRLTAAGKLILTK